MALIAPGECSPATGPEIFYTRRSIALALRINQHRHAGATGLRSKTHTWRRHFAALPRQTNRCHRNSLTAAHISKGSSSFCVHARSSRWAESPCAPISACSRSGARFKVLRPFRSGTAQTTDLGAICRACSSPIIRASKIRSLASSHKLCWHASCKISGDSSRRVCPYERRHES